MKTAIVPWPPVVWWSSTDCWKNRATAEWHAFVGSHTNVLCDEAFQSRVWTTTKHAASIFATEVLRPCHPLMLENHVSLYDIDALANIIAIVCPLALAIGPQLC